MIRNLYMLAQVHHRFLNKGEKSGKISDKSNILIDICVVVTHFFKTCILQSNSCKLLNELCLRQKNGS